MLFEISVSYFCFAGDNGSLTLEEQFAKLRAEKEALEADFGVKRAKFKELFLQKEGVLLISIYY